MLDQTNRPYTNMCGMYHGTALLKLQYNDHQNNHLGANFSLSESQPTYLRLEENSQRERR